MNSTYIVALEIGSSKIKAAVAEVTPGVNGHKALNLIALEEQKTSDDVRHGVISNVDAVSEAMSNLLQRIENYPAIRPRKVKGVYAAIGGRSVSASPISVETNLPEEEKITKKIILDLANDARHHFMEYNGSKRDILQVCSGGFTNNGRPEPDPIGRYSTNIGGKFKIISARPDLKRNLHRVITDSQELDYDLVVRPMAIAALATTVEQRNKGCVLVDFGADTTTIVVFRGGDLQYLSTLPLGSRLITHDLMTLNFEEEEADNFKRSVSSLIDNNFDNEQDAHANEYVVARALEIISNIEAQISYSGYTPKELPVGIILTGLGSRLRGFPEKLAEVTKMPVQIARPAYNINIHTARLDQEEHLDILSILYKASLSPNIRECLTEYEEAATPVQPVPNEHYPQPGIPPQYNQQGNQQHYGQQGNQQHYGQQGNQPYNQYAGQGNQYSQQGNQQQYNPYNQPGSQQQNGQLGNPPQYNQGANPPQYNQGVNPAGPVRTPNPNDPFRSNGDDDDILKDDDIPTNSKGKGFFSSKSKKDKEKESQKPEEPKEPKGKEPSKINKLLQKISLIMTYEGDQDDEEETKK